MEIMTVSQPGFEPHRAHSFDAGADLRACIDGAVTIRPGEQVEVSSGTAIELPRGFVALVAPRSGLACRHGITLVNSPGIIDCGYTGEIRLTLTNLSKSCYTVRPGDRVAQLLVLSCELPRFVAAASLPDTERGNGGYGSTGVA
jgi:dUTP pyrophosphatase